MLNPQILPPLREPEPEAPTPAIRVIESTDTYASVALEPLERGFATTVGNPLRRLLLSSIQGTAVTWVKIEDVPHEYSVIPGVKEEVMDLLLSVKRIRIHALAKRPGKMRLDVTGEGRVCAGDIPPPAIFRLSTPNCTWLPWTTPTFRSPSSSTWSPARVTSRSPRATAWPALPVGVLPVDAIYNPVRKVEYSVERMMVGQQTDWERLVLQVWTDGAVTPLAAIQEASENLVQHFYMFNQLSRPADSPLDTTNLSVASEVYLMPIERLDLSSRTLNCLKRAKLDRVGQVLELTSDDLLNIRNFGQKSLEELQGKLAELGVSSARTAEAVEDLDFAPDSGVLSSGSLIFEPDDDLDYDDDGD